MDNVLMAICIMLGTALGLTIAIVAIMIQNQCKAADRNATVRHWLIERIRQTKDRTECEAFTRMYCELTLSLLGQPRIQALEELIEPVAHCPIECLRAISEMIDEPSLRAAVMNRQKTILELNKNGAPSASHLLSFSRGRRPMRKLGFDTRVKHRRQRIGNG